MLDWLCVLRGLDGLGEVTVHKIVKVTCCRKQNLISLKVSSKRLLFHCNFCYKHFNPKSQSKNTIKTIKHNYVFVKIG